MNSIVFTRVKNEDVPGYDLVLGCNDMTSSYYGVILVIDFSYITTVLNENRYNFTEKLIKDVLEYLKYIRMFSHSKYSLPIYMINVIKKFHIDMILSKVHNPEYTIIDSCCVWMSVHRDLDSRTINNIRSLICKYIMHEINKEGSIATKTLLKMDVNSIIHIFRGLNIGANSAFYYFFSSYVNDNNRNVVSDFLLEKTSAIRIAILVKEFRELYWPATNIDDVVRSSMAKTRSNDDFHLKYNISLSENGECYIDVIDMMTYNNPIIYSCSC